MKNNYTKFEEDIDKSMNQTTIFGTERNGTEAGFCAVIA